MDMDTLRPYAWLMFWIATLAFIVALEITVYRSKLSENRKRALYVVNVLMPVIGVLLFLSWNEKNFVHKKEV